ncbi:MAG: GTP-binding protein [Oscillospiraceae bacterium]|jgi:small GTP-binding protein|nr:GTP-binding protein [Oscillospiraceae bacterium]
MNFLKKRLFAFAGAFICSVCTGFSVSSALELDLTCKVIVVGDAGTGKTSIIKKATQGEFLLEERPTIGVDIASLTIKTSSEKNVKLQIWDTAGQERFRSISTSYIRGSAATLFVFDCNNLDSAANLQQYWFEHVRQHLDEDCIFVIVANKFDLLQNYDVLTPVFERLEGSLRDIKPGAKIKCFEVSACFGLNIDALFEDIAEALVNSPPVYSFGVLAPRAPEKTQSKCSC